MDEELYSLQGKGNFKDVVPATGAKPAVFEIKRKADGAVEGYKARLIIRGVLTTSRVNVFKTFRPVVGFDVLRTVLSTIALRRWSIRALYFN